MRSPVRIAAVTCALVAATLSGATALSAPGSAQATRAAGASTISKPADGFSLAVPSGWKPGTDATVAAVMAQADRPDVTVKVRVQREKAPADVTDVLAKALVQMKGDTAVTLVSNKFDVFLDRPALFAEFEDGAGGRFKTVMVPREVEDRSQVFYVLTAGAPKASFAKLAPALDKAIAGFQILTGSSSASGKSTPASGKSTPPRGFDREKVIERILAPRPIGSSQD